MTYIEAAARWHAFHVSFSARVHAFHLSDEAMRRWKLALGIIALLLFSLACLWLAVVGD
jgi:hypothetical protein